MVVIPAWRSAPWRQLVSWLLATAAVTAGVFGFPSLASANSPPQYCVVQVGNTFVGTCDRYFASIPDAAQQLADEWLPQRMRETGSRYWWVGEASYGTYPGPFSVRITRPANWFNAAYGVNVSENYVVDVVPVCHQGPQPPGSRPYPLPGVPESQACPYDSLRIDLAGPARTKALPAGPSLPQTAIVMQGGMPVAGRQVTVRADGGSVLQGVTDASGAVAFLYVPPVHRAVTVGLSATCDGCSNTAQKTLVVDYCPICERGDGSFGNPIYPGSGLKAQAESDWVDAAAHGLTFTRTYVSQRSAAAGLGAGGWSHNFAGELTVDPSGAVVALGSGQRTAFVPEGSGWKSTTNPDRLTISGTSAEYVRASDDTRFTFSSGRLVRITARNGWAWNIQLDANGLVQTVTNAFGRTLQLQYDAAKRLVALTTPDGSQLTYGYDAASRLTGVRYADGSTRGYQYEDTHPDALTGITDESGTRLATFTYDADGRAVGTQHAGGADSYSVAYDPAPPVAGQVILGASVDPSIYTMGATVTDALGNRQRYTWLGGDGHVRRVGASGPFEGETAASRTTVAGLVATEVDFLGTVTQHAWDVARQLEVATTRAAGRPEEQTTQTQWHPSFALPLTVTEPGRLTTYTYDEAGNRLSETITDTASGEARTRAWTYANGLVQTMTDPRGGAWHYAYDAAGNRTSITDPLGRVSTFTYDAAGRLLAETAPGGLVTTYGHDARGRQTSRSAAGESTLYTYTPTGQIASVTLPNGYRTAYAYDDAQRLVGATDNRGASVRFTLDAAGNRIREVVLDPSGSIASVTTRVVDGFNRIAAIQGAAGQTTALAYDANGEQVSATDPVNQTTRQSLDALRRPTATTFADGSSATQAWNALDQLTQVKDPKSVATSYTYNVFGEVLTETSPDVGTIRYTRDAIGAVTQVQDAKGQIAAIDRDALGRIRHITYAADLQVDVSYDAAGFVSGVDDASGSTRYQRDALGRVLAKRQVVNDNAANPSNYQVAYGYTGGDLTSARYPSGLQVFYRRSAGRIVGIDVQAPGQALVPFVSDLAHNALDQPTAWAWSNGASASRRFDADGRLLASEIASYGYDAAGRITGITQQLWARRTTDTGASQLFQVPVTWTAGYDSRNRLVSFVRSGAETRYTYDANSNRLTSVDTISGASDFDAVLAGDNRTQTTAQSLNVDTASNRLLGFTQTVTTAQNGRPASVVKMTIPYVVDTNGSMTSDGLRSFDYDASGRLAKVEILLDGEAASVSYLHNALGQRVFKGEPQVQQTLPNENRLGSGFMNWLRKQFGWIFAGGPKSALGQAFVYGDGELPEWALLGSYDNGSVAAHGNSEFLWLPTDDGGAIPVGLYKGGVLYAIHSDHLGTPRLITDASNSVVWQWPYSAFGQNKPTGVLDAGTSTGSALKGTRTGVEMQLRLPGQFADDETGLAYNYFRSYMPGQGRYGQADLLGLGGGLNRFSYVGDNPLSGVDPRGLQASPDDRPAVPGPFVPNPSAAAQQDLAKMLDRLFCPQEPDCWDLQQQMEAVAGELRQRYVSMTADVGSLFCTRPVGRFSWLGHQWKFNDKRRQLQKLIEKAQAKGCAVNGEYIKLVAMDPPSCPAR